MRLFSRRFFIGLSLLLVHGFPEGVIVAFSLSKVVVVPASVDVADFEDFVPIEVFAELGEDRLFEKIVLFESTKKH